MHMISTHDGKMVIRFSCWLYCLGTDNLTATNSLILQWNVPDGFYKFIYPLSTLLSTYNISILVFNTL